MKRTRFINLAAMRKKPEGRATKRTSLSLAIASILGLGGCDDEAEIYTSIYDCTRANPGAAELCRFAYEAAQEEAVLEAPRYNRRPDCEYDFGQDECQSVLSRSGNGYDYIPLVGAFMLPAGALAFDDDRDFELDIDIYRGKKYRSKPLFTSKSRRSPAYRNWVTGSGQNFGRTSTRKVSAGKSAFTPKPAVKKTLSRGGFGSTVKAKSSWGGSSRSSWGG